MVVFCRGVCVATLAILINDRVLTDRIAGVMASVDEVRTIVVGTDLRAVSRLAASGRIDAYCFLPMAASAILGIRRTLLRSTMQTSPMRRALVVDKADAVVVYHALACGIDDVIDLSGDDGRFRAAFTTFATRTGLACDSMVAPTVPIPEPVVIGRIDYADDTDRKIVVLISVGYTDREIGDILHYSHQVIRNRISQLLLRSGLRNRTQLASRHTFETIEGGSRGEPFFTAWTQ